MESQFQSKTNTKHNQQQLSLVADFFFFYYNKFISASDCSLAILIFFRFPKKEEKSFWNVQ